MARGYFSSPITLVADLGAGQAGLSTVGYAIKNGDGTTFQARTTTGVSEVSGGIYKVRLGAGAFTDTFDGYVVWDTGGGSPKYASEELQMVAAPATPADVDVQIESDIALIADAVWDELLADHQVEGSAGDALERPINPPTLISAIEE